MKRCTKYYGPEHEDAYRRIEREGKSGWDELHGGAGFDDFSSRAFLEQVLPSYLLHRRHLKPEALRAELERSGFRVLWQGGVLGGDVVCALG